MYNSLCFEDILDRCIVRMRESGRSVEECLFEFPMQRDELDPLLRLVHRLQASQSLSAPNAFRQATSTRMANLLAAHPHKAQIEKNKGFNWEKRFNFLGLLLPVRSYAVLSVVLAILCFSLITSGIVYASGNSLPGEPLYPAKIAVENLQLALTSSSGDTELHLEFASHRLDEISKILKENRKEDIGQLLVNYNKEINATLASLADSAGKPPNEQKELADRLVAELVQDEARLSEIMAMAPEQYSQAIQAALETSKMGRDRLLDVIRLLPVGPEGLPGTLATLRASVTTMWSKATPTPSSSPTVSPQGEPSVTPTISEWETEYAGTEQFNSPAYWASRTPLAPYARTRIPTEWATLRPTNRATPRNWPTDWPTPQWTPRLRTQPTIPTRPNRGTTWPTPRSWPTEAPDPTVPP